MKIYRVVLTLDVWAEDQDEAIAMASIETDGVSIKDVDIVDVREE